MVEPDETWDPGGMNQMYPNKHVCSVIIASICAVNDHSMGYMDDKDQDESRTELDTHTNMPVVGRNVMIIDDLGETVDVNAFSPDYPTMKAKLVDVAVRYDCPYDGQPYLLLIRNAIYVPSMKNNLIPPFVMREAGIQVYDTPKIHIVDPTENDHAITFCETGFRIPLNLWGVFSYFSTSKPEADDHESIEEVYILTPPKWNPHTDIYSRNKENMIDWEGNMIQRKDRVRLLLSDIEDNTDMVASLSVGSVETVWINSRIMERELKASEECRRFDKIPREVDEVSAVMLGISPLLCPETLCARMEHHVEIGKFQEAIGSTFA